MKIVEDFEFDKKHSDQSTGEYLQRGTYFMYTFDSYKLTKKRKPNALALRRKCDPFI